MLTVIIMKWGPRYGVQSVNALFNAIRKYAPHDTAFICFTDDTRGMQDGIECRPLPEIDLPEKYRWSYWRKISLFSPHLGISGDCLYLDVDTVVLNPIEPLLENWHGSPRFIKRWQGKREKVKQRLDQVNSSVLLFKQELSHSVWHEFHARQTEVLAKYPGDQGFIHEVLSSQAEYFQPNLCVSFKKHCISKFPLNFFFTPKPPDDAVVVCFHGKPDPQEALAGHWKGRLKQMSRPAPWAMGEK